MEGGPLWQHRLWQFSHIMVCNGTGTKFTLSQTQKNVHKALHVYYTLCSSEQVYCVFDLLRSRVPLS